MSDKDYLVTLSSRSDFYFLNLRFILFKKVQKFPFPFPLILSEDTIFSINFLLEVFVEKFAPENWSLKGRVCSLFLFY